MKKFAAPDPFKKVWDAHINAFIEDEFGTNANKAVRMAATQIYDQRYKLRQSIQARVNDLLKGLLENTESAVDLMAGTANATLPLVISGDLDRLVLVDDGASQRTWRVAHAMVDRFDLWEKVELATMPIEGADKIQPDIKEATLLESGLAMPCKARCASMPNPLSKNVNDWRSLHTGSRRLELPQVLRVLSKEVEKRVLHIVDTPSAQSHIKSQEIREYIESCIAHVDGWSMEYFQSLPVTGDTFYSRLVFKTPQ